MNRLLEIGFKYAGNWCLKDGRLECELKSHGASKNVLYAFISNGDVRYIGKTTQQLKNRFSGYRNPTKTQSTNINNNANIMALLERQEPVDIFVLPDNGLLNYGGFPINLAAGLEDSLIGHISPPWNGGNREQGVVENGASLSFSKQAELKEQPSQHEESHALASLVVPEVKVAFELQLGIAYYNQGFFNVPVKYQEFFGSDGEEIEIYLGDIESPIVGYINRTANRNATPRIMGGKEMKHWIMGGFKQGDHLKICVFSCHSVRVQTL